jgi:hypothetical protein
VVAEALIDDITPKSGEISFELSLPGMGSTTSILEGNAKSKAAPGERTTGLRSNHTLMTEKEPMKVDESRLTELMQAIQRFTRLQREATSASIDARQKRREAAFKRQDVWIWDAKFMVEVQRLTAEGKLAGLEELLRLGEKCQNSRNDLGPIEQEGIELEQRWEGNIWKLRQAEEHLYTEFAYEFEAAESYPQAPMSDGLSDYSASPESADQEEENPEKGQSVIPHQHGASVASSSSFLEFGGERVLTVQQAGSLPETAPQNSMLLGIDRPENEIATLYSDSGIGDIDVPLENRNAGDLPGPPYPLPGEPTSSIELYPNLLTDFASRRERINNWLENTVLLSRMEATSLYTVLKGLLEAEKLEMPSNWSQLVIAYWERDVAAIPGSRPTQLRPRPPSLTRGSRPSRKEQEQTLN